MRLIDLHSLQVEEFFSDDVPEYAILSHTWGPQEASLPEWSQRDDPDVESMRGYQKIFSACKLAKRFSWDYLWVDTNCIDKTSSAELSEAINSMFAWYRNAQKCFVYLEDVVLDPASTSIPDIASLIQHSRWFTRGWTLQELLAPKSVSFYDKNWKYITDKASSLHALSLITSIPASVLEKQENIRNASIAQRMSWLSKRDTTRREDMAYCMFGIFDINLPLLYGEGDKAFTRLQEELIRSSYDHTIFCWSWPKATKPPAWVPALAPNAAAFANSSKVIQRPGGGIGRLPSDYSITNLGIRMQLPILLSSDRTCFALLDAYTEDMDEDTCLAIPLRRADTIWILQSVFWRADYPSDTITLPYAWGRKSFEIRLARPGTQPEDYGHGQGLDTLLSKTGLGYWPDIPESKYAVVTLAEPFRGFPSKQSHVRGYTFGGIVYLAATAAPTVWYREVATPDIDADADYILVTIIAQEYKGKVRWSVTRERVPVENIEDWALVQFRTSRRRRHKALQKFEREEIPIQVVQELELEKSALGPLESVVVMPVLLSNKGMSRQAADALRFSNGADGADGAWYR
ncbi:hypothetical protein NLG97_g6466 [Lecanicillium saksenae]|uniref:Uncharacterized protein n=1 Tax=Lecanicillium saksenae TaxID=468837 RepID=A0ACC1QQV9_9HYPO|nr:hypothetical protein NLG97_g6466 [Lecanicillium saksenae]